jgi:hypothetical protein
VQQTTDNESGFWDRSLGNVVSGTATSGPNQIRTASNRTLAPGSSRKGDLSVATDATGNFTELIVRRDGPCLPTGGECWQRFVYDWNEVGELVRARRWDLATAERTSRLPRVAAAIARPPLTPSNPVGDAAKSCVIADCCAIDHCSRTNLERVEAEALLQVWLTCAVR